MPFAELIAKWKDSGGAERANKDSFLSDLCDALGVGKPSPTTGDPNADRYVFERDAFLSHENGKVTIGKIDLYKHDCFVLEAKQGSEAGSKKIGTAKRATARWNIEMRDAFGQALGYAKTLDDPPPFIITCDIGYCFDLYATFDGTWNYRAFPDALSSRIYLTDIEKYAERLRAIFTDPHSLDPSKHAAKVTREIATHIANLARALEDQGHEPERVAKFLMRCLFTMFAEDVDLLPKETFAKALEGWYEEPDRFVPELEALWSAMNEGGALPFIGKILQFNGGLFAEPFALPLDKQQLWLLRLAAASNWSEVEPAIFGTLLERALNPKERHALGAHYTPRAYVERLVGPTIEEPLRAEWELVQAEVRQIIAAAKSDDDQKAMLAARKPVQAFYDRLRKIRILDPACGSGNFLFVALDLMKRLENEVLDLLSDLGDTAVFVTHGNPISPGQFLGIEVKAWAKEITELVLWIGYLQWQIRTRGWKTHVPEPVLRDYHNIEHRDAVLAWDDIVPVVDDGGNPVTQWDGETTKTHRVTGKEVPDETAQLQKFRYVNPRKAEWPKADFIVGNPPFIGNKRMRNVLGDEYVKALRAAHSDVAETADYVMYWWNHAAHLLRRGAIQRFGFITTNSITQVFNRKVLANHLDAADPLSIVFAIRDHPWVDSVDGAAVRVAMTTCVAGRAEGRLFAVVTETESGDGAIAILLSERVGRIHANLSVGADVSDVLPLKANQSLAFMGVTPAGDGFRIPREHPDANVSLSVVKRFVTGRDLLGENKERLIIDLFGLSDVEARATYPQLYQWLLERVKPDRDQNKRSAYRDRWWVFAEPRPQLRAALQGLARYVGIVRVAKHYVFHSLPSNLLPDSGIIAVATEDMFVLGVLSSSIHHLFARTRSGTLEDRPYWNTSLAFDPYPFPYPSHDLKDRIRKLGEDLDAHRKRQQELHPTLSITAMYNVMEKLRAGQPFTAKEKIVHERGLVSVLKQLHDDLDAAVFDAYGWPHELTDEQILERMTALNVERAAEEKRGLIRWLRPEFQNPKGKAVAMQQEIGIGVAETDAPETPSELTWPEGSPAQLAALRSFLYSVAGTWSAKQIAKRFKGGKKKEVEAALASLEALGIVVSYGDGDDRVWTALRPAASQRRMVPLII